MEGDYSVPFLVCILGGGRAWTGYSWPGPGIQSLLPYPPRHVEPLSSDGSRGGSSWRSAPAEGSLALLASRGILSALVGSIQVYCLTGPNPLPKLVLRLILLKEWDKVLPLIAPPFTYLHPHISTSGAWLLIESNFCG